MGKGLAAGLWLILCGLWGYREAWRLQGRCQDLQVLEQFLVLLKGEIRYTSVALPEVFERYGATCRFGNTRAGLAAAHWLEALAEALWAQEGDFFQVWKQQLHFYGQDSCLKSADLTLLELFGNSLGTVDQASQLELLEYYRLQFLEQKKAAAEYAQIYGRIYQVVGVCGGACLLVLLL